MANQPGAICTGLPTPSLPRETGTGQVGWAGGGGPPSPRDLERLTGKDLNLTTRSGEEED